MAKKLTATCSIFTAANSGTINSQLLNEYNLKLQLTQALIMTDSATVREHIKLMLTKGLPPSLTYHNVDHTLDVETRCMAIAAGEGITDKQALEELRTAALYHDYGFIHTYEGHEVKSCDLARKELPGFGFTAKAINNICEIILATRVPQMPATTLQEIICDADLDYLGRDDYLIINENLRIEMTKYRLVFSKAEWEESRIAFLQLHQYFTDYSKKLRDPKKSANLNYLLSMKGGV